MARLAIKGHATRGKEVIEILEMLGGINHNHCCGVFESRIYIIDEKTDEIIDVSRIFHDDYNLFTLEEFLKKYPYKVGDMVRVPEYESEVCIDDMKWNGFEIQYSVSADETENLYEWYSVEELNECDESHKEEVDVNDNKILLNMSAIDYNNGLVGYEIPAGYEFDTVIDNKVVLKKLKSQYPKNYEECHEFMVQWTGGDCNPNSELIFCDVPIHDFCKLIVARNVYWKIVGEQMGLGNPWEPDWSHNGDIKYTIEGSYGEIIFGKNFHNHKILAFPIEEMRNAFYENFKDLIEACKELL
jgi:hypothetical protein